MNRISTRLGIALFSAMAIGAVGCSHQTAGQKAQAEAHEKTNAADMMLRGEKHIADGEAEIKRGQTIKDQGDSVEGDRQIAEGKALKSLGEEELTQGKKLKDKD